MVVLCGLISRELYLQLLISLNIMSVRVLHEAAVCSSSLRYEYSSEHIAIACFLLAPPPGDMQENLSAVCWLAWEAQLQFC